VTGEAAGAVLDLVATAGAGRGDQGVGGSRADGREEDEFADPLRKVKVLRLVAERTGHAAAARRDDAHHMTRGQLEHPHGRSGG